MSPPMTCGPQASGVLSGNSWVIGVALAVLAALANNLGVNMQKLAWTKKQLKQARGPVYRLIWVVGLLGVILASVFDFVALFFAPQSVIAPLGALTMVSNACVAPWMHGEVMHRITLLATLVIVAGCVMSVASSNHTNSICPPDALFQLYFAPLFLGYVAFLVTLMLGIVLFVRKAEAAQAKFGNDDPAYRRYFKIHRFSYAFLAGLFGAQSVLFTRSFNQLIVATTNGGKNLFLYGQTWGIIIGLVGSIVFQLYWLNHGLARFESLYNVPVFTTAFIIDVVLGGGFLYGEFAGFSLIQAILFPLGILLCVAGVIVLTTCSGSIAEDEEVCDYDDDAHPPLDHIDENAPKIVGDLPPLPILNHHPGTMGPARPSTLSRRISLVIDELIDELSPRTSSMHSMHHPESPAHGHHLSGANNHGSSAASLRSSFSMLPHTTLVIAGASEPRIRSARHTHVGSPSAGSHRHGQSSRRRASHSHGSPADSATPSTDRKMPRVQSLTVFSSKSRNGSLEGPAALSPVLSIAELEGESDSVPASPPIRPSALPTGLIAKLHQERLEDDRDSSADV